MSTIIKIFAKVQAKQITDDKTVISFDLIFFYVFSNPLGTYLDSLRRRDPPELQILFSLTHRCMFV